MNDLSTQPRLPALCPYCGHGHQLAPDRPRPLQCEACKGRFEPLSRQATQNAMGPWQIRDTTQPFRPPCSYETIVRLTQRGRIIPSTIVRGPTTRQFWAYARDTPGIAALLGFCHACHTPISADDAECPSCKAVLHPPTDRQQLGLSPRAVLPGEAPVEQIAAMVRPSAPPPIVAEPPSPVRADLPAPLPSPLPGTARTSAPAADRREARSGGSATPWLIALVVVQFAALLTVGAIWLYERASGGAVVVTDAPADLPDETPLPMPEPLPDAGADEPAAPDPEPLPDEPGPAADDLDLLMDEAMLPFSERYWPLVEATRSGDPEVLSRAIARLRALRDEAAAADPDGSFPLTDDLIAMASEELNRLRLIEQFAERP